MTRAWAAAPVKVLRIFPALFMRDPLFRYAAIAAIVALLFLIAQFAQDWAGPPAISAMPAGNAGGANQPSAASTAGRTQRPVAPVPAEIPTIAPGRPLNAIVVDPPPVDAFGKLPKGARSP